MLLRGSTPQQGLGRSAVPMAMAGGVRPGTSGGGFRVQLQLNPAQKEAVALSVAGGMASLAIGGGGANPSSKGGALVGGSGGGKVGKLRASVRS